MSKYNKIVSMNKHRMGRSGKLGRVRSTRKKIIGEDILKPDGKVGRFQDIAVNKRLYHFSSVRFQGTNYAVCAFQKIHGPQFAVPVSNLT